MHGDRRSEIGGREVATVLDLGELAQRGKGRERKVFDEMVD